MKDTHKQRLLAIIPLLCTGLVLWIATLLQPDPSGIGTHHQLGLNPCGFLTEIGYPCPMCGMTTSFAHYVQLQLIEGFINSSAFCFSYLRRAFAIYQLLSIN